jgi:hypothetical protein
MQSKTLVVNGCCNSRRQLDRDGERWRWRRWHGRLVTWRMHGHGHFDHRFHFNRNLFLGGWGWDWGLGGGYGDNGYGNTTVVAFPQAKPQTVTGSTSPCHWNEEAFKVPSSTGGTQPVSVVSCH